MNALDPPLAIQRRRLSLDPRFIKFFGITVWVVIFLGYLATMPMSPRYSTVEVVGTLTFILGGLVLLVISLRRYKEVSLEGDCLYLAGRRGEISVPLESVAEITEVGRRSTGNRTLRVRLLESFEFGKEFYFLVGSVDAEARAMFTTYTPHPLLEELRGLVEQAKLRIESEQGGAG